MIEFRRLNRCEGKRQYLTPQHARFDARQIRRRRDRRVEAYHCPYCRYWHVGSNPTHDRP
ncbi:MAG: hypothetical protein KGJ45_11425 [Elusimicrobia bacterium]|nr:hypothetical protein [Elusimicrobiota bacterium]